MITIFFAILFNWLSYRGKNHFANLAVSDIAVIVAFIYGTVNFLFITKGISDLSFYYICLTVASAYILFRSNENKLSAAYGLMFSGVIQSIISLIQLLGYFQSNNHFFQITGSFNNPGQLGGFLCISLLSASGIYYISERKSIKILALISAFVILGCLILTDSRAAWLGVIAGGMFFSYIFIPKIKHFKNVKYAVIILVFGIGLLLAGLYFYKPVSANGRLFIWKTTSLMIKEKPFWGHGINTFSNEYMHYQAEMVKKTHEAEALTADNVAYAFNEFLKLMVEQGIVGMLLFIGVLCFLFTSCNSYNNKLFKSLIVGFLVFSFFSYPTDVFPLLILFPIVFGTIQSKVIWRIYRKIVVLLFSALLFSTIVLGVNHIKKYTLLNRLYLTDVEFVKQHYSMVRYNRRFMDIYSQYAKNLNSEWGLKVMNDAINVAPSSDLYFDLGSLYHSNQDFEKAENCFMQAHYMVPTKISPYYGLFLIKKEQNKQRDALEMAYKIMRHQSKVENTVYLKIKSEAKVYIDNIKHQRIN